jgi:hypothetical protein
MQQALFFLLNKSSFLLIFNSYRSNLERVTLLITVTAGQGMKSLRQVKPWERGFHGWHRVFIVFVLPYVGIDLAMG